MPSDLIARRKGSVRCPRSDSFRARAGEAAGEAASSRGATLRCRCRPTEDRRLPKRVVAAARFGSGAPGERLTLGAATQSGRGSRKQAAAIWPLPRPLEAPGKASPIGKCHPAAILGLAPPEAVSDTGSEHRASCRGLYRAPIPAHSNGPSKSPPPRHSRDPRETIGAAYSCLTPNGRRWPLPAVCRS